MWKRWKLGLLQKLLAWFAREELDQWEIWEYDTPHGKVWVQVTRQSPYEDLPAK